MADLMNAFRKPSIDSPEKDNSLYGGDVLNMQPLDISGTLRDQQVSARNLQEELDSVMPEPEISEEAKMEMVGRGLASSRMDDLISAGIPALAGIVAGVPEAGFKAGADNLATSMKWRREDQKSENARLMALWKAKAKKDSTPTKLQKVTFEDGTMGFFDPSEGKTFDQNKTWVPNKRIKTPFAEKDETKKVRALNKEFAKEHGRVEQTIADLDVALEQFGKGTLNDKLAVMNIVKQIEGRMTDEDRNFYLGNVGWWNNIKEKVEQQKEGKLPDRLINEAKMFLQDTLDKTYDSFERRKRSFQSRRDSEVDYIDSAKLPPKRKVTIKKKAETPKRITGKDKYGNTVWVLPEHLDAAIEEGFVRD